MLTLFVTSEDLFSLTININNLNKKTMKKLLLFAAAAVAFGASAQTLTQMWKNEDVKKFAVWDTRQGVGMNGKVYINVGAEKKVYVVDEKGISATTLPGTANTTINRDQAGNLIVSTPVFPTPFGEADNLSLIHI